MERDMILAFDVGTSSLKASVVDREGRIAASEKAVYDTYHPAPGISQQDPEDWWRGVCAVSSALAERRPDLVGRIAAIGVSGHMLGCIPVDHRGTPLYLALIHSDSRAGRQFGVIEQLVGAQEIYKMSGNVLDARASLCKMLWFRQEEPEIYGRTAKFLQSKDYIAAKLTGNIDTTDLSDGSHGALIDITKRAYDPALYRTLDLDPAKLPALHAGTDIVGYLTKESAHAMGLTEGIPVIAGGGDGACADLGAGNVRAGDTYCCLGTTAWISRFVPAPYFDPEHRTFNIMSLDGVNCCMFGTMQSAGGAVSWAMDLLGIENVEEFNRLAADAPPGSDGLLFLPYLDGERSPLFDAAASGMFFGLSLSHTRAHGARATFEGVGYALRSILEVFLEQGDSPQIRMIGGGAKSQLWRQILADIWKRPAAMLNTSADDATSLGVAAAAATAAGLFPDLAQAAAHITTGQVQQVSDQAPVYDPYYSVFRDLYEKTAGDMHLLRELAAKQRREGMRNG